MSSFVLDPPPTPPDLSSTVPESLSEREQSLQKLKGDGWLDDNIVFDYLRMKFPECVVVDTVVWSKTHYDFKKYHVPTSRTSFASTRALIPVWQSHPLHWMMAVLDLEAGLVVHFDPLHQTLSQQAVSKLFIIADLLMEAYHGPNGERPDVSIRRASPKTFVRQEDGNNCGPLACMIAYGVVHGTPLHDITVEDIKVWRQETFDFLVANTPPPFPRGRLQGHEERSEPVQP